jgi:2-polyprenyl-3-methyl-5-hydroxy-6-metoxy-1,4-benzoquinol methylase
MGFAACDPRARREPALPPIEWEECDCPLCGGSDWSHKVEAPEPGPIARARWFLVVECRHCGLCYTNPRPTDACLARLYPPAQHVLRVDASSRGSWLPWRDPLRRIWPLLERGELLDIGCGIGSLLRRLCQRGRSFTAVNLSPEAAELMRRHWRLPAYAGSLPHPHLSGMRFDAITLFDLLQCVQRPLELLQNAHDLLADNGTLIVAVPNVDSLPFRWFGADWPGLNLPRHLTHFTPHTLGLLLHQAGFRLRRLSSLRHSGWLRHAELRASGSFGDAGGWGNLLRQKPVASLVSWYTALLRRANGMLAIATH